MHDGSAYSDSSSAAVSEAEGSGHTGQLGSHRATERHVLLHGIVL